MSLRALAKTIPCDPGHLSKVLAGHKRPSPELAARIDEILDTGGLLARLVSSPPDREDPLLHAARHPRRVDTATVNELASTLASYRRLDDSIGSNAVLAPTLTQLRLIETLVTEARGATRRSLVDVASQWCQFAGWLHINTGAPGKAQTWFDQALVWAAETGDANMTSEALSMKGSQAWRAGHVGAPWAYPKRRSAIRRRSPASTPFQPPKKPAVTP